MKKQTFNTISTKDYERIKQENKKIKEEYEKYKEVTENKLKDFESISIQYEKAKKENEELKKKFSKSNTTNNNQNILLKTIDKLKFDMYHKDSQIKILTKHRDLLISILTKLGCKKNYISSEMLLSYLEEDNDKEKDHLINKLNNEIIDIIKDNQKKNKLKNFSITKYSFDINKNSNKNLSNNIKKNLAYCSNVVNNYQNNINNNDLGYSNEEKEIELIKKINDMLYKIQKRKEVLKTQKNLISLKITGGIEGK